jgi:hypothetical protein
MFNGAHSATEFGTSSLVVHQWSVNRSSVGPERMSHERMVLDRASVGEWCSPMSVDRSSEDRLCTPMSVDRMSVDFAPTGFQSPSRPMLREDRSMSIDSTQSPINHNLTSTPGWTAVRRMSFFRPSSKGSSIERRASTFMLADRTLSVGPIFTDRSSIERMSVEQQRPPPNTSYARYVVDNITLHSVLIQLTYTRCQSIVWVPLNYKMTHEQGMVQS